MVILSSSTAGMLMLGMSYSISFRCFWIAYIDSLFCCILRIKWLWWVAVQQDEALKGNFVEDFCSAIFHSHHFEAFKANFIEDFCSVIFHSHNFEAFKVNFVEDFCSVIIYSHNFTYITLTFKDWFHFMFNKCVWKQCAVCCNKSLRSWTQHKHAG